MNLLLSSFVRLSHVYGEREARRVLGAIEQLMRAREARGITSRLLLIEDGMSELGVAGAEAVPATIAAQLAGVAGALERQGDTLESILIVGGPSIIPFDLAPNPTQYDGDTAVPSDSLYGVREDGALMPEWPVGRLPGSEGASARAELLVRMLRQAVRLHERGALDRPRKSFGYSTAVWREASAQVYAEISDAPLLLSPPVVEATLDRSLLDGANIVYCNLHGVRDGPVWYGQAEGANGYLIALQPDDVLQTRLSGALVFSEACYGAMVDGRDERNSMALAFLARGAACFVGATAMSYGPAVAPLSEADLLALHFWRAVRRGSTTVGMAFLEARAQMLLETLSRQSALDEDDRKTALEFVLYGDPTLRI